MRQKLLGLRRFLHPREEEQQQGHDEVHQTRAHTNKSICKRDRRSNTVVIMSSSATAKLLRNPLPELCRVFSRDSSGSETTTNNSAASADVSWDDKSSSSVWTAIRPCLKLCTQQDSLRYSYYDKGGFDTMTYRVDFSTQTVYFHDLSVQELRGPQDQKEKEVKPHSISMQQDPWQVVVSSIPSAAKVESTSREDQKRNINRWSRPTRERLWFRFCKEVRLEKQQRLYRELRLAEQELNEITALAVDPEQYQEQTRELEQTLDAMEEIW